MDYNIYIFNHNDIFIIAKYIGTTNFFYVNMSDTFPFYNYVISN